MAGQNYANTKSNPFEWRISPANAGRLATKWTFTANGDTSATPAVVDGAVYLPDWGGFLSKLDARTGQVIWSHRISEYNGLPGSLSRTSPAVTGNRVYIGDQNAPAGGGGAHLMSIDATTGALVWISTLDTHFAAVLTQSPVVHNGVVYQGVASKEEAVASLPNYPCCTFRGSMNAVDATTGRVLWKTYMVPENGGVPGGFSGNGVWGSTPVLDFRDHTVIVTTGNNYTVPQSVTDCQTAGNPPATCFPPDNYIDSIVALDMTTGTIRWAAGDRQFDTWNLACLPGVPPHNCPENPGDDFDFGDGAHLFTVPGRHGPRLVVGAGQKSGMYYTVDARTGAVVWSAGYGPGGVHGGVEWGSATDGRRIYLANANTNHVPVTLTSGETTSNGYFAALDTATGRLLWETADPAADETMAAVTTANGVMFAGSMSGHMYALDGRTGRILWDHLGEGSSNAGPAIVNGTVYWGNGYNNRFISRLGSRTFYAFSIDGR
jgi:polyvinyl alcohol dehydrogenase (cytochrome)